MSDLLTALARLTRAVSVLVDTLGKWFGGAAYLGEPSGTRRMAPRHYADRLAPVSTCRLQLSSHSWVGADRPIAQPEKRIKAGEPWFQVRHGLPVNHK